jgi:hypothetical protein
MAENGQSVDPSSDTEVEGRPLLAQELVTTTDPIMTKAKVFLAYIPTRHEISEMPWVELVGGTTAYSVPPGLESVLIRIKYNWSRFQLNYSLIVVGCGLFSIFTSPVSLMLSILLTLAAYVGYSQKEIQQSVLDGIHSNVSLKITLAVVAMMIVGIFAMSIFTWVTFCGGCVCLLHSVARDERMLESRISIDHLEENLTNGEEVLEGNSASTAARRKNVGSAR